MTRPPALPIPYYTVPTRQQLLRRKIRALRPDHLDDLILAIVTGKFQPKDPETLAVALEYRELRRLPCLI